MELKVLASRASPTKNGKGRKSPPIFPRPTALVQATFPRIITTQPIKVPGIAIATTVLAGGPVAVNSVMFIPKIPLTD